jgi:long-chain fatty acid transport protein
MTKSILKFVSRTYFLQILFLLFCSSSYAMNGDILIGVGPISRSMGGVGIALPQDTLTAYSANPAAFCFDSSCSSSEVDFGVTLLTPAPDAEIKVGDNLFKANSHRKVYTLPAVGISMPINDRWRFGIAAYAVSGLGVDYRNTALDKPKFYDLSAAFGAPPGTATFPLTTGTYTQLQILQFSPSVAFRPTDKLSVGLAIDIDYGMLDLQEGTSLNYGIGAQFGVLYDVNDYLKVGMTYITPKPVTYKNVCDMNKDGKLDDLELESPQEFGFGIAMSPIRDKLLFETDLKWINWHASEGYKDFGFDNQVVVALGAQYRAADKLLLRIGYNYGKNPVREHEGFNGANMIDVQGKKLPKYFCETFRIIGTPTIIEHHISAGMGYEVSKKVMINVGYTHAFNNTVKERGTDVVGNDVTLKSSVSGDSIEFGLRWLF